MSAERTVLVTGGAGYIGSHTAVELLEADYDVVIVDNLDNASSKSIDAVAAITGRRASFYELDVADADALGQVFADHDIDGVIHFAGLKAVGESVEKPLQYYRTNLGSTMTLLEVMEAAEVHTLVFSSSATVYGNAKVVPVDETAPLGTTNPYGATKLMIEDILRDVAASDPKWRFALLRYFNPVGAHPSGLIGEDPKGIPNNLMPYVMQVAVEKLDKLRVFGDDYDTPDGTGVRDYIHVVDLARGHLAALDRLKRDPGAHVYNLGTGIGTSVLDVLRAAETAVGRKIPYEIVGRRSGDVASLYADPALARQELNWAAEYRIDDMVRDHWNWQSRNPDGYGTG